MFEIVQAITVHEDRSYEYTVCVSNQVAHAVADFSYGHSIGKTLFMFGLGRFAVTKQRRARDARSVSV